MLKGDRPMRKVTSYFFLITETLFIPMHLHTTLVATLIACSLTAPAYADDASIIAALKSKGVTFTETGTMGITLKKDPGLAESDYKQIRQLTHLKSFSCAGGFDDAALKTIAGLPELETFGCNGFSVTDEGTRTLASFKALKKVALFHPPKGMKGTGLSALAELSGLENLTVAGSTEFADEGMAAVGKLTQLKEFRTWHSGVTVEGLKNLKSMKQLKSLWIGQRLSYTPPATLSDDAIAIISDLSSIESLTLDEAKLSLNALSQLKKLTHLKKLTLNNILISEPDLAALKSTLAHTDIKHTAPTDQNMKRINSFLGASK
jgi:hypothetical protein